MSESVNQNSIGFDNNSNSSVSSIETTEAYVTNLTEVINYNILNRNKIMSSGTKELKIGGRTISVSTKVLVAKDVVVKSAIDREKRRNLPADKLDTYLEWMKRKINLK